MANIVESGRQYYEIKLAFANSDGGTIYSGIDNEGNVTKG